MRSVRISENFVPISDFKAQTAEWLRKLAETDAPVVVTQNGKPAGVLLSPQAPAATVHRNPSPPVCTCVPAPG